MGDIQLFVPLSSVRRWTWFCGGRENSLGNPCVKCEDNVCTALRKFIWTTVERVWCVILGTGENEWLCDEPILVVLHLLHAAAGRQWGLCADVQTGCPAICLP